MSVIMTILFDHCTSRRGKAGEWLKKSLFQLVRQELGERSSSYGVHT
jgi:hypothetical protein